MTNQKRITPNNLLQSDLHQSDLQMVLRDRLHTSLTDIKSYCQRWHIRELALFGSVLRDDFRPESDVDVLVAFEGGDCLTLSNWLEMQEEIEQLLGRTVDLTQKDLLKNPFSRVEILRSHRIIYPTEQADLITIVPANQPMQDEVRNNAALFDMIQAIQKIQQFTQSAALENYLADAFMQSAVERQFEVLGEAARRTTPEFQQAHPEIDWRNTIGLRNIIAHQYEQVQQEKLWEILTTELPGLLVQLEALLPPLPTEEEGN